MPHSLSITAVKQLIKKLNHVADLAADGELTAPEHTLALAYLTDLAALFGAKVVPLTDVVEPPTPAVEGGNSFHTSTLEATQTATLAHISEVAHYQIPISKVESVAPPAPTPPVPPITETPVVAEPPAAPLPTTDELESKVVIEEEPVWVMPPPLPVVTVPPPTIEEEAVPPVVDAAPIIDTLAPHEPFAVNEVEPPLEVVPVAKAVTMPKFVADDDDDDDTHSHYHSPKPAADPLHSPLSADLFELPELRNIGKGYGSGKIYDLQAAFGINERLFDIRELFSGDSVAHARALDQLNTLATFEEARHYLDSEVINRYSWGNAAKIKKAIPFLAKVKRRYIQ